MAIDKTKLIEEIQKHLVKGKWKDAVSGMEQLFAMNPDPIIRVRMGDAYQKLNSRPEATREYVYAADLYAEQGAVVKALAQYKLALRIDPNHRRAIDRMSALHSNKVIVEKKAEPVDEGKSKPANSAVPLFAGFTQGEFEEFAKLMNVHQFASGEIIVREGDKGKSVYIIASGSVKVYTKMLSGDIVDLAKLMPSEFFGEIAFLTGKPRTATIETLEDTVILEMTEDKLQELIDKHPHVRDVLKDYSEMRLKGTIETVISKSVD
ncbi:MAG: cyclic nucleotide-binding domain-containing protein [Nitrospiraceae bacterium]|nr:cyclic nucleotide-binding domain-containing protein [Nitrospiraceae bacterium]